MAKGEEVYGRVEFRGQEEERVYGGWCSGLGALQSWEQVEQQIYEMPCI